MSPQEVDITDEPLKPFKIPSNPGAPDRNLAAALGVHLESDDSETFDEQKAEKEEDVSGKEHSDSDTQAEAAKKEAEVRKHEARVQDASEELYGTLLYRAKNEEGFLDTLATSEDAMDRKMAKKILKRNSEFGASTLEEYQKEVRLREAGDDPVAKKFAEQEYEIKALRSKQSTSDWQTWKQSRKVEEGSTFDTELDTIRSDYPQLPFADIVSLAKGRQGAVAESSKPSASTAIGSSGAPEEDDVLSSPIASRILGKTDVKAAKKFGREYFRTSTF